MRGAINDGGLKPTLQPTRGPSLRLQYVSSRVLPQNTRYEYAV